MILNAVLRDSELSTSDIKAMHVHLPRLQQHKITIEKFNGDLREVDW